MPPWALPDNATWRTILALAAVLVPVLLGFLVVALIVAVQAMWRGYPVVLWTIAGMLGNPIFLLVILGAMPDYERKRQREEERKELETRARSVAKRLPPVAPEIVVPKATPAVERSIGDQPTTLPERSIGDEQTRA
jgi:hypothetical protein